MKYNWCQRNIWCVVFLLSVVTECSAELIAFGFHVEISLLLKLCYVFFSLWKWRIFAYRIFLPSGVSASASSLLLVLHITRWFENSPSSFLEISLESFRFVSGMYCPVCMILFHYVSNWKFLTSILVYRLLFFPVIFRDWKFLRLSGFERLVLFWNLADSCVRNFTGTAHRCYDLIFSV